MRVGLTVVLLCLVLPLIGCQADQGRAPARAEAGPKGGSAADVSSGEPSDYASRQSGGHLPPDHPPDHLSESRPFEIREISLKEPFRYQLDAKKLGQERGAFGDKEDAPDEWTYTYTSPTPDILFPVGSSDRRYYIEMNSHELIFESKSKAGIQLWWRVRTVPIGPGDSIETQANAPGTLELIMAGFGRRFESGLPAVIEKDLKRRRPYAWYKVHSLFYVVHCGYITAEGDHFGSSSEYWNGESAYPISKEERAELAKMKKASPSGSTPVD